MRTMVALTALVLASGAEAAGGGAKHHGPGATERLSVAEPVRTYKSAAACAAALGQLPPKHGALLYGPVRLNGSEVRVYHRSETGTPVVTEHHCAGAGLVKRQWYAEAGHGEAAAAH